MKSQIKIVSPSEAVLYTSSLNTLSGPKGDKGDTGDTGPQGPQGLKGDKGDTGATGATGATGSAGANGSSGAQGIQGIQGVKGDTGLTGPQGVEGPQGPSGEKGDQGEVGPQGPQGLTGATGPQGPKGDTGLTGFSWDVTRIGANGYVVGDIVNYLGNYYICIANNDALIPTTALGVYWNNYSFVGPQGPQGIEGPAGSQGQAGASVTLKGSVANVSALPSVDNTIGDSYINDEDGNLYVWTGTVWHDAGQIVGPEGPQGQQGIQGVKGDTGEQGPQGNVGPQGPQGEQGIQGNTSKLSYSFTQVIPNSSLFPTATLTIARDPLFAGALGANVKLGGYTPGTTGLSHTIFGIIVSQTPTTLVVSVGQVALNTAYDNLSEWEIHVSGQRGLTGNTGATGPAGATIPLVYYCKTSVNLSTIVPSYDWNSTTNKIYISTLQGGAAFPQNSSLNPNVPFLITGNNGDNVYATGIVDHWENGSLIVRVHYLNYDPNIPIVDDFSIQLTGFSGPQGANGSNGAQGPQGPQGETGPAGPTGSTGATGAEGPQGPAGTNGTDGVQNVFVSATAPASPQTNWIWIVI